MPIKLKIAVLGAGSWGTALARLLSKKGHRVSIWAYEKEVAEGINKRHRNPVYLKEVPLPQGLKAFNDLSEALEGAQMVVSVVPSHTLRGVIRNARPFIAKRTTIVSCTKGIEIATGRLVSEILEEELPQIDKKRFTYLSGPSFAKDVAGDLPTTVVIAGRDSKVTKSVQKVFRTDNFLTFTHNDVVGVELGGALKNIIAIAAGVSDGLGFGDNSRAALITRGLYETIKIGAVYGAKPLTFAGLSGIGDLILTCTSRTSRNYTFGYQLGRGKRVKDILKKMKMVAEGVKTAEAIHSIIKKHKIVAPICEEMYKIIHKNKPPKEAAYDLTHIKLHEELKRII